jgi:dienelactone hydrolase
MKRRGWMTVAALTVILGLALGFAGRRGHHARTGEWLGGSWLTEGWFEEGEPELDASELLAIQNAPTVRWCAPGLEAIPGGGCFAAPATAREGNRPRPLVIYLHGIFDPAAASEELSRQARVADRALSLGFAVLALHGHVGQCSAPEYATRVCWPSNERNEGAGPSYVAEWKAPLAVAKQRGAGGRRYVLGFSNGGYFAGLLAERAWFDAGAFVIARAGPVEPVRPTGWKAPLLLTLSDGDPSRDEMVKLDEELARGDWAHERFVAKGGHALPDGDIDAAMAFFVRQERETAKR